MESLLYVAAWTAIQVAVVVMGATIALFIWKRFIIHDIASEVVERVTYRIRLMQRIDRENEQHELRERNRDDSTGGVDP